MKRTLFIFAAMIICTMVCAQSYRPVDEGYVFVSNVKTYSQRSVKSRVKSTIHAGRAAICNENREYVFPCVDAMEYITLGSGSFHKYYPLAQDLVAPEYIPSVAFNKAVRKVSVSKESPKNWELGKRYTFNPPFTNEFIKPIKVRTVRLSGSDVTLVTEVDQDFKPSSTISMTGETIIEISLAENTLYFYKGKQIVPAISTTGNYDYCSLVVDDNGVTFAQTEDGVRRADPNLSYVYGQYPEIEYFGWISDKEVIVDDVLYVASEE